ncbi:hypothetical protein [Pseudoduganella flava]|uniref:Uncharacterized protein n=1 Tax=Pseudoduganella flava TaxID=871742 RepID=A0ABX6FLV8_9BURK|nr:hypothetical protein [Pseudoduganella flava]QGZ38298.1 hypothetical protein GO485_04020 [Pseudoduganella flava]
MPGLRPAVAAVLGDRKQLVQVVANILHNETPYTPGRVTITVRLTSWRTPWGWRSSTTALA